MIRTAVREEKVGRARREDSGYINRPSVEVEFVSTSFVRLKFGHTHTHTRTHARTHTRTHARTHTMTVAETGY